MNSSLKRTKEEGMKEFLWYFSLCCNHIVIIINYFDVLWNHTQFQKNKKILTHNSIHSRYRAAFYVSSQNKKKNIKKITNKHDLDGEH